MALAYCVAILNLCLLLRGSSLCVFAGSGLPAMMIVLRNILKHQVTQLAAEAIHHGIHFNNGHIFF